MGAQLTVMEVDPSRMNTACSCEHVGQGIRDFVANKGEWMREKFTEEDFGALPPSTHTLSSQIHDAVSAHFKLFALQMFLKQAYYVDQKADTTLAYCLTKLLAKSVKDITILSINETRFLCQTPAQIDKAKAEFKELLDQANEWIELQVSYFEGQGLKH